ncbi:class I SAM-dependent methyltransferase [Paenibacillus sepulcri]|uniref:Class I SAM-dependent methyltransferase n=1 Tax=Paenibacillus sepulcri TaxID=359917 RepID=A0ABS7BV31_9BACL|nr:class I SAM-dependent methyltransferase [Paenibacillus sepulcri]
MEHSVEYSREKNINIWENLYSQQEGDLFYPNEYLVRVSHRLLNKEAHHKILDYGFGSGTNLIHFLKKGFTVSGVEVSESAIEQVASKLERSGLEAILKHDKSGIIPFEDDSFDVVIAWQVLIYNDWATFHKAMNEINRVLRSGGIFLGTMGAVGDFSHSNSISLGNNLFESTVPGQEGAILMIFEKEDLQQCFPDKNITVGMYDFSFAERHSKHWIVSYVK